jgi:hypothetical protein
MAKKFSNFGKDYSSPAPLEGSPAALPPSSPVSPYRTASGSLITLARLLGRSAARGSVSNARVDRTPQPCEPSACPNEPSEVNRSIS